MYKVLHTFGKQLSKNADKYYTKCMDESTQLLLYLQKAGIETGAARIYIELSTFGPSSALQLAKNTKVSRTQVYRHLEALQSYGLTSAEQLSYGTLFRALPLTNLDAVFADRQAQAGTLQKDLRGMAALLQHIAGSAGPQASVQHHYGLAGLKQANWNLTKAKHEFRVFEVAHISDHLDKAFASRMRERIVERNLHSYDLTNATKVAMADIEPFAPSRTHFRHIDPQLLTINFELYIYDGVVALLDYSPQAMQAIEIHHPALHAMMKQLFESMWNLGEPLTPS